MNKKNIRQDIIDIATKLFYENGFDATTIADIANALNTSKGHITYYFNTKDELGKIVYTNYINNLNQTIHDKLTAKYGGYDSATAMAIGFRLANQMFKEYPKAFNFYVEVTPHILNIVPERGQTNLNEITTQFRINSFRNDGIQDFKSFAWAGAVYMVIAQYFRGNINMAFEEFDDRRGRLPFMISEVDPKVINRIVKESKAILKELDIKIKPYFQFE